MIKSLDKMEKVVDSHPDLAWEGWDVLWYQPNPAGFLKKEGAFYKGKWRILHRIEVTRDGWQVPRSLLRRT